MSDCNHNWVTLRGHTGEDLLITCTECGDKANHREITRLQAENEALRERLENYEALKRMHRLDNYPNELSAKAWLLRKQAEAVDEIDGLLCVADSAQDLARLSKSYALQLRTQAAELERQSEGGE